MEPDKIQRINELKRLSRERELLEEELAEQAALRAEYIAGFRANMQQVLEAVRIQESDGSLTPLKKKGDTPT
ncbi:MAG: DUF896 domain-containing protein [Candidatus Limiplasma sp.]|nr:DUF896 domain-containing protein [Candidatus Limiplasma sp.]